MHAYLPDALAAPPLAPPSRTRGSRLAALHLTPRRWLALALGLAGYTAYAAVGTGQALGPGAIGGLGAAAALAALGAQRDVLARGLVSAALLGLATFHARALDPNLTAWLAQLALASAVATSALTTLAAPRLQGDHPRPGRGLALAALVAAAIALAAPVLTPASCLTAAAGALIAWPRPLGAVAAALAVIGRFDGPRDPALFWRPVRQEADRG